MQQRRHGCGSKQHACVEPQAAVDGGTIAIDGRQPVCVRQWAADAACVQQCAAERRVCDSVQQRRCEQVGAASSTIAMEDSDGSRWRWWCKEQRLTATSC
jgi:hypothetical protein